jgi:hypothetical protein
MRKFKERMQLPALSYCGMPSVEFLDVLAWSSELSRVEAIEYDEDTYDDMRLQWKNLALPIACNCHLDNIYDYIGNTTETFDLYNLDFYGGFLNRKKTGGSNATESLRQLVARHGSKSHSFILITTFQVRQSVTNEYVQFIDQLEELLTAGCKNVAENCEQHKKKGSLRLKIGYSNFCWDLGRAHGFAVRFADIFCYQSSVPLLHFYAEFTHVAQPLPSLPSLQALAALANKPLKRLVGLVPTVDFRPAQIEVPE